jgi:hypothetical protein
MMKVIGCESQFNPTIQSGYYQNGVQEQSFGLSQINLPSNPGITLAEADDPSFSIRFMAQKFSEGYASKWSCWRKLYQ